MKPNIDHFIVNNKIIDKANNRHETFFTEALHIKKSHN